MMQLEAMIQQHHSPNSTDKWSYIWNSNQFSVKKAYRQLKGHISLHPVYKWLWKSSCQKKHKVFFWLLINDRLSTRDLLKRKRMALPDYSCIHCPAMVEESTFHLFLDCPYARQCWAWLNLQVNQLLDPFQILQSFRNQLQVPFSMEILILMCWIIWKARNDWIFRQIEPDLQSSKFSFRTELQWLSLRLKRRHLEVFQQWISSLS
jgi:hypothetical protein